MLFDRHVCLRVALEDDTLWQPCHSNPATDIRGFQVISSLESRWERSSLQIAMLGRCQQLNSLHVSSSLQDICSSHYEYRKAIAFAMSIAWESEVAVIASRQHKTCCSSLQGKSSYNVHRTQTLSAGRLYENANVGQLARYWQCWGDIVDGTRAGEQCPPSTSCGPEILVFPILPTVIGAYDIFDCLHAFWVGCRALQRPMCDLSTTTTPVVLQDLPVTAWTPWHTDATPFLHDLAFASKCPLTVLIKLQQRPLTFVGIALSLLSGCSFVRQECSPLSSLRFWSKSWVYRSLCWKEWQRSSI